MKSSTTTVRDKQVVNRPDKRQLDPLKQQALLEKDQAPDYEAPVIEMALALCESNDGG